jgi:hypothetical protein
LEEASIDVEERIRIDNDGLEHSRRLAVGSEPNEGGVHMDDSQCYDSRIVDADAVQ